MTSADQLLNNDRLRNYMLTAFDIDPNTYSRQTLKGVLTSDLDDPASYFNTQFAGRQTAAEAAIQTATTELSGLESNDANKARIAELKAEITRQSAIVANVQKYRSLMQSGAMSAPWMLASDAKARPASLISNTKSITCAPATVGSGTRERRSGAGSK